MAAIVSVLSTFTNKFPCLPTSHASSFRMCNQTTTRRSGNYGPPTWDFTYIQSLNTNYYTAESFVTRRDELKERVKNMLNNEEMKEVEKMEMIDELQRLGCCYHFEDEIKAALMDIYMKKNSNSYKSEKKDLYATALEFTVLRQNGFNISQDVFDCFMDGERSGFNDSLCEDTSGILKLYEASFLSMEEIGHLPKYMRFCYLALHNFVNEVAYDVLKEHDIFILHYLRKSWVHLCKAYFQEAKWYRSGYTPTFEEYIENAWISSSCPLILVHAFFYVNNPVEDAAALHCLTDYHEIIRLSSMILRLANDKGTSPDEMKRGDVPKAIQCYMNDAKVSVNEAHDFVDFQINEIWKKMNKARVEGSPFSEKFIEVAMNIARMAQCMYQHGDGHGIKNFETQTRIQTILFEPIPLI